MKTNNKTQTNNTTTMWDTKQQTLKNKTIMKTIKIEWTVDHWLTVLPDGTVKTDVHLPSLIVAVANGDRDIARKIEIVF